MATMDNCNNSPQLQKLGNNHDNNNAKTLARRLLFQHQSSSSSAPVLNGSSPSATASSSHSSPSPSTTNRHNDPALYTALFRRKFVKVFTGWDLRASAERRWSRRGGKSNKTNNAKTKAQRTKSDKQLTQQTSIRTSPCLQNCLECEAPVRSVKMRKNQKPNMKKEYQLSGNSSI